MLEDDLEKLIYNEALPLAPREELTRYLNLLRRNIIPPINRIMDVIAELKKVYVCGNLRQDGSCLWLARNANKEGLRRPAPGERAYCHRVDKKNARHTMQACKGYLEDTIK